MTCNIFQQWQQPSEGRLGRDLRSPAPGAPGLRIFEKAGHGAQRREPHQRAGGAGEEKSFKSPAFSLSAKFGDFVCTLPGREGCNQALRLW